MTYSTLDKASDTGAIYETHRDKQEQKAARVHPRHRCVAPLELTVTMYKGTEAGHALRDLGARDGRVSNKWGIAYTMSGNNAPKQEIKLPGRISAGF